MRLSDCVCIHTFTCIYLFIYLYLVHRSIFVYVCVRVYKCMSMYVCDVCFYVYMWLIRTYLSCVYIHVFMFTYMYIKAHMCAYVHLRVHAYMCICMRIVPERPVVCKASASRVIGVALQIASCIWSCRLINSSLLASRAPVDRLCLPATWLHRSGDFWYERPLLELCDFSNSAFDRQRAVLQWLSVRVNGVTPKPFTSFLKNLSLLRKLCFPVYT